jgi:hypothetical protein
VVAGLPFLGLHLQICVQSSADDILHGGRRLRAPHRQHLAVGQLAAGQGRLEKRQRTELAGDAHALPRRAEIGADALAESLCAGAGDVPAAVDVELAEERRQPRGGGVELSGQLGDLVAEAFVRAGMIFGRGVAPACTGARARAAAGVGEATEPAGS